MSYISFKYVVLVIQLWVMAASSLGDEVENRLVDSTGTVYVLELPSSSWAVVVFARIKEIGSVTVLTGRPHLERMVLFSSSYSSSSRVPASDLGVECIVFEILQNKEDALRKAADISPDSEGAKFNIVVDAASFIANSTPVENAEFSRKDEPPESPFKEDFGGDEP